MKVLIVSANREEINMRTWPLGAACVASAVSRAGHDVELLDLMQSTDPEGAVKTAIDALQPHVIGVSVRNIDDQKMASPQFFLEDIRRLISLSRSLTDAPIVIGGAGYSIFPSSLLEYLGADMGIRGEGETVFVSLLDRLERGGGIVGSNGIYLRHSGLQGDRIFVRDLDMLPLPDPRFLPHRQLGRDEEFWVPVQTRRGCAMKCSYCSTAAIEGCTVRKRTPHKVVEWINACSALGFPRYYFVDNTFNLPPSYARKLCSELLQSGLNIEWRCIVYPLPIDEDLIRLMVTAGCQEVAVGFESGSQLILSGMNKRFRPEDVRNVCDAFGKHGVGRMGFLLLGGPGETKETAIESLTFADSLGLECVKVTVGIRIYPDTALQRTAIREAVVSPDDNLLEPRFYLAMGLDEWLQETVSDWMSTRPNWIT